MSDKRKKRPKCSMCGRCCSAPTVMITKPSDYKRWVEQGRQDILRYATVPPPHGYGDLWRNPRDGEIITHCPFAQEIENNKYICSIHETKPKVCREFRCEWAYGAGKKGVPFKTDCGWTDKAQKLGYGKR
ncbi:MAG: YkgJ family cysteine cluster protein [Dehalococcoidales bacterium]|nr:YkgJ family cysteine cluster protein [Dehalococcoidales bacterium]